MWRSNDKVVGIYLYRVLVVLFSANVHSGTYRACLAGSESICVVVGIDRDGLWLANGYRVSIRKGEKQESADKVRWSFDRSVIII